MNYSRKELTRYVKERVLILCEGSKTEPTYFKSIKSDMSKINMLSGLKIVIHDSKKNTAKHLVDEAITFKKAAAKEGNPYNEIWVVYDRDGYTKHPEAFIRARDTNINIAFSSTCFEFWLLLHFEYTTAPFSDCDSVIDRLKTHIPNYEKNGNYYLNLLKPNTQDAIERGNRIIAHCNQTGDGKIWEFNPYTDVGKLVEKLLSL